MEKANDKVQCTKGFTLAETLLAVLIMLMVSTIMVNGIPAAKAAYERVVLASNADVLLSTATASLRSELATAQDITILEEGTKLTYVSNRLGAVSMIRKADGENDTDPGPNDEVIPSGTILIQRYTNLGPGKKGAIVRLISKEAATADLYVSFGTVSFNESTGILSFNQVQVKRVSDQRVLAQYGSTGVFSIRIIL